jgi:hypothetical protein
MAKMTVENVLQPGKTYTVDTDKYQAMRTAYLAVLPTHPGMTTAEVGKAVLPYLPSDLFPGGEKAGWWCKAVQLDLEAKGMIVRHGAPVRLSRI